MLSHYLTAKYNSAGLLKLVLTLATCKEVIVKNNLLITYVSQSPGSDKIYLVAVEVYTSSVVCSAEEKASIFPIHTKIYYH